MDDISMDKSAQALISDDDSLRRYAARVHDSHQESREQMACAWQELFLAY